MKSIEDILPEGQYMHLCDGPHEHDNKCKSCNKNFEIIDFVKIVRDKKYPFAGFFLFKYIGEAYRCSNAMGRKFKKIYAYHFLAQFESGRMIPI